MKKLILILALLTLNSYAIDCLRANFEIHKMTNYKDGVAKGMVIDSVYLEYRDPQHSTEFDHSKYYWTGDQLDSAIAYQKKSTTLMNGKLLFKELLIQPHTQVTEQ